jgi:antirestriction protein
MALTLYANPYDTSVNGFYFKDFEDYEKKEKKSRAEEFEIEFIDGDDTEQMLFEAMGVNQGNIEEYFDAVDDLDDEDVLKISILTEDIGYDFGDAMDKKDDLIVYGEHDSDEDFAMEYIEGIGSIGDALGKNADSYFDYDSFGRDLRIDGYGQVWVVEWETSDDKGELDEEFHDYDEAESAGQSWEEEAEDDGEEDASYEIVEKASDMSDQDVGEQYVDDIGGVGELDSKTQEMYFDWSSFARDLMMDMGKVGSGRGGVYYDPSSV